MKLLLQFGGEDLPAQASPTLEDDAFVPDAEVARRQQAAILAGVLLAAPFAGGWYLPEELPLPLGIGETSAPEFLIQGGVDVVYTYQGDEIAPEVVPSLDDDVDLRPVVIMPRAVVLSPWPDDDFAAPATFGLDDDVELRPVIILPRVVLPASGADEDFPAPPASFGVEESEPPPPPPARVPRPAEQPITDAGVDYALPLGIGESAGPEFLFVGAVPAIEYSFAGDEFAATAAPFGLDDDGEGLVIVRGRVVQLWIWLGDEGQGAPIVDDTQLWPVPELRPRTVPPVIYVPPSEDAIGQAVTLGIEPELAPPLVVVPSRTVMPWFVDDEFAAGAAPFGLEDDPSPPLVVARRAVVRFDQVNDEFAAGAPAFGLEDDGEALIIVRGRSAQLCIWLGDEGFAASSIPEDESPRPILPVPLRRAQIGSAWHHDELAGPTISVADEALLPLTVRPRTVASQPLAVEDDLAQVVLFGLDDVADPPPLVLWCPPPILPTYIQDEVCGGILVDVFQTVRATFRNWYVKAERTWVVESERDWAVRSNPRP